MPDKRHVPNWLQKFTANSRLRDVEQTHRDKRGVVARAVPLEAALVFFRLRQIGRVKEHRKHVERDGPNDQHEEPVEAPVDLGVPLKCDPPLQNQQQQGRDGKDNVDLIERVFPPAVKRAPGAGEQVRHAQTDDDRHQRSDELETAHEIQLVLHGARP